LTRIGVIVALVVVAWSIYMIKILYKLHCCDVAPFIWSYVIL